MSETKCQRLDVRIGNELGPIAGQAHLLHEAHILLVVVVAVASNVSTGTVNDVTRHLGCDSGVGEEVPL